MADKYTGTNLLSKDFTEEDANKALLDLLKKTNEVSGETSTLATDVTALDARIVSNGTGIIESGSTANGIYIKYSNGFIEQWNIVALGAVTDSGLVPRYWANAVWTYPIPMVQKYAGDAELYASNYHDAYARTWDTATPLVTTNVYGVCNRLAGISGALNWARVHVSGLWK
jgi:hypothetical protein